MTTDIALGSTVYFTKDGKLMKGKVGMIIVGMVGIDADTVSEVTPPLNLRGGDTMNEAKCCFCGTDMGALIQLHQGWCCVRCFQELLDIMRSSAYNRHERR